MSADVLLYNALNEFNKCIINQNAVVDANIAAQNALCTAAQNAINANSVGIVTGSGPNQANMWCLIPSLPETGCPWTSGFKVCDTNAQFNCGACCAWTVPGGATCARFQLWGAGAGSGFPCCCAFTPLGGTGAYASVIIPVTPGDVYTLCAGCAHCCVPSPGYSNTNGYSGCQSFVTGTGLTNFCAEGGESSIWCQSLTRCMCGPATYNWCVFLGGCICTNNSVCWQGAYNSTQGGQGAPSCCFDNMFPMISSCKRYYGTATCGTVYGVRGSFGSIAINCNGTICVQHPPIVGFSTNSCCVQLINNNYLGGTCRSAAAGYLQVPGAGAWANMKCGGNASTPFGDTGRMGMVCVSFR